MTMLIKRPSDIAPSTITPRDVYLRRREFMAGAAGLALAAVAPTGVGAAPLTAAKSPLSTTDEPATPVKDITSYNNFYEFGTGKDDPAKNAHTLTTKPWTVKVDGLVGKPADYNLEDLVDMVSPGGAHLSHALRGGWSMVIPWVGVPLAAILKKVDPQGSAKYVAFETLVRPSEMPGQKGFGQPLPWPYVEGLRMDEAMHPLDHHGGRPLRRDAAQPERRAVPAGGAVEVRLQEHQVGRAHQPDREAAADHLEQANAAASTASIPTSTRRSIIRAGARRASDASARAGCS